MKPNTTVDDATVILKVVPRVAMKTTEEMARELAAEGIYPKGLSGLLACKIGMDEDACFQAWSRASDAEIKQKYEELKCQN